MLGTLGALGLLAGRGTEPIDWRALMNGQRPMPQPGEVPTYTPSDVSTMPVGEMKPLPEGGSYAQMTSGGLLPGAMHGGGGSPVGSLMGSAMGGAMPPGAGAMPGAIGGAFGAPFGWFGGGGKVAQDVAQRGRPTMPGRGTLGEMNVASDSSYGPLR